MKRYLVLLLLFLVPACSTHSSAPQSAQVSAADIPLGEEYASHGRYRNSPRSGRGSASVSRALLLYLPNRFMDFVDIFRFDVGVGASAGAALRMSKWGQLSWRRFWPGSLRFGLRGREMPFFIEDSTQIGVGSRVLDGTERSMSPLEFGAGVDLLVIGGYAGVSVDSIADFILGIFGLDISDDDYS